MKLVELTFEDFLDARTEWNEALQRSLDPHIFLTWEWLSVWWKHFGDKRNSLVIVVTDGKKILAAAPVMSSRYTLFGLKLEKIEFIGIPASDYHSFLLTERKPAYVKMIIEYAINVSPTWDFIELKEIPENFETARILRVISKEPFKFEERIVRQCPYILLPSKYEDYSRTLSYRFRKNLRRCERNLRQNYKVDFKICDNIEAISNEMKTFFNLHQKRWRSKNQPGAFSDRRFRDFHLDVARSFADKGWLALDMILLNGEPVAAGYNFKYAGKLYYYLSGFDPLFSKYSVGNLRQMYLIKYCIESGLKEYDFMRGDEPYKERWNTFKRRSLQFTAIKARAIPIVYDWIRRNNKLFSLTYVFAQILGKKLSPD